MRTDSDSRVCVRCFASTATARCSKSRAAQVERPFTALHRCLHIRPDAEQLLSWNRGHWSVEVNHHIRDRTLGEDDCMTRTNNGPSNLAMCNNIVLALIIRKNKFKSVPEALRHFNLNRYEAFDALMSPT